MNPRSATPSTRRSFLSRLAVAGAAVPLAQFAATAGAAEAKKGKKAKQAAAPTTTAPVPGAAGVMHVFSKPLQWLDYAGTAALIKEAGFGGIDYTVRSAGHVLPEKVQDDLPRAIEAAKKAGLKVEMITTAITDPSDKH